MVALLTSTTPAHSQQDSQARIVKLISMTWMVFWLAGTETSVGECSPGAPRAPHHPPGAVTVKEPSASASTPIVVPFTWTCADEMGAPLPSSTTVPLICRVCAFARAPRAAMQASRRLPVASRLTREVRAGLWSVKRFHAVRGSRPRRPSRGGSARAADRRSGCRGRRAVAQELPSGRHYTF